MTSRGRLTRRLGTRRPLTRAALTLAAALLGAATLAACAAPTAPTPIPATPSPDPAATPSSATSAAPSVSPSGSPAGSGGRTGRLEFEADGFAVTLAPGWLEFPLDADAVPDFLATLPAGVTFDAGLAEQLPALIDAGMKVWAFDLSDATLSAGSSANLSVIVEDGGVPPGLLADLARRQLAGVEGIDPAAAISDVELDGVDGIRVDYRIAAQAVDDVEIEGTRVYASTATKLYTVTFVTRGRTLAMQQAIDGMIGTLEFLG